MKHQKNDLTTFNMTQVQFAAYADVSHGTVSKWAQGIPLSRKSTKAIEAALAKLRKRMQTPKPKAVRARA